MTRKKAKVTERIGWHKSGWIPNNYEQLWCECHAPLMIVKAEGGYIIAKCWECGERAIIGKVVSEQDVDE